MKPPVLCRYCNDYIRPKNLQRHFTEGCPNAPAILPGQRICSTCQELKPLCDFPKNRTSVSGFGRTCNNCGMLHAREWRANGGKSPLIPTAGEPKIRPGAWILKPCKYCGEMLNYKQRLFHRSRCANRPHSVYHQTYDGAPIINDMPAVKAEAITGERAQRSRNLQYGYGITVDQYDAMLAVQGGKCAICNATSSGSNRGTKGWLHVDHCHATEAIRGLLCHTCNLGIGYFKNNPALLLAAMGYLLKYHPVDVVS